MMADPDLSLLTFLRYHYPIVPITTLLKIMNKCENDLDKCQQALNSEPEMRFNMADSESSTLSVSCNSNNNVESTDGGKSIISRTKELHVSHEDGPLSKIQNQERHVSTIERSVGNTPRPPEQSQRPLVSQSMSWIMQAPDRLSAPGVQAPVSQTTMTTPQTAPPDFSSFFSRSATDIPNINCRTHGTSGLGSGLTGSILSGSRPQQIPLSLVSTSSSPMVQRHPVKVVNIPAGSLSGGSVSSAVTPSNPRHIHMNFGDSGGICTISTPPPVMHRYRSTPNISQNYVSEIRTEAPTSQPVHSSSIVVDTSSHASHPTPEKKLNASISLNDSSVGGRRTPYPPHTLNTDILSNSGASNVFSSGKLSTPVQASSPGISHSKPVFIENKTDRFPGAHGGYNGTSCAPGFNLGGSVRPPPLNPSFFPHQSMMFGAHNPMIYNTQFNQDFPNPVGFPPSQLQNGYPFNNSQQQTQPGFHSTPSNLGQHPASTGYAPSLYSQFSTPPSLMDYQLIPGHYPGQTPSNFHQFMHYSPDLGRSPGLHMYKSPSIVGQHSLGSSRSNSQDSDQGMVMDYDVRHPSYNLMGSHTAGLNSLSSDSSSRAEGVDSSTKSRSGSTDEEPEYVRALIQHQKRQMQKLLEEVNNHRRILNKLRSEVGIMEKNKLESSHVSKSFPSIDDISGLCENNRRLQTDIQLYMNEIDMYKSGQTPFNKISPLDQQNFFENMPTGQQDPIYSISPDGLRPSSPNLTPPPRPPPPIPVRQRSTESRHASGGSASGGDVFRVPPVPPSQPTVNSGDSEEGESWSCSACTFSNHPALKKCEMCEMPRVMPSHPTSSVGPPAVNPQHSLSAIPPRLVPGSGLVGNMHPRSGPPHPAMGFQQHHHHAGT